MWGGDGWLIAYQTGWDGTCRIIHLRKLDRQGNAIAGPVVAAGGDGLLQSLWRPRVAWTGSEIGIVWSDVEPDSTCTGWYNSGRVQFRRYTPFLAPVSDATPIDCTSSTDGDPGISWRRRR